MQKIAISQRTKTENLYDMRLLIIFILSGFIYYAEANFTKISKNNVLLSRRKRYLLFPMGSNLVMTMSAVKSLLQVQPRGYNILFEVDVPFALPSDTRVFAKNKKRKERRSIYNQLDTALTHTGFNGTACVKRIICDARQFIPLKGKSLVKDLIMAIFTSPESNFEDDYNSGSCDTNGMSECEVPFLDYILKSFEAGLVTPRD